MSRVSLYNSLNHGKAEVRLITIQAAESYSTPLEATLEIHSLEEPSLAFQALSYCWGKDEAQEEITINGLRFYIRRNLFDALKRLRRQREHRTLCIDAICIDQNSVSEKNHQVPLMRKIYTRAEQVVAWLGEEDDDTWLAINF